MLNQLLESETVISPASPASAASPALRTSPVTPASAFNQNMMKKTRIHDEIRFNNNN